MINVLYIGDISARPGREMTLSVLPELRKKHHVDLVIAGIENLAHGKGATVDTVREIMAGGVDFMTGGNHIWRRPDFEELLGGDFPVIRSINYPPDVPGRGFQVIDLGKKGKVLIALVQGRTGINDPVTHDMLRPLDSMLSDQDVDGLSAVIIEIHAEATSEKIATGLYLDGRVSAVVGTHTHVPTADERILPKGTGFITDIGMVGTMNSSLWVKAEIVQQQIKYPYAPAYEVEEKGKRRFDAVLLEIDGPRSCTRITRVNKVA